LDPLMPDPPIVISLAIGVVQGTIRKAVRWFFALERLTCFQMTAWIRFRSSSLSLGNRTAKRLPLTQVTVAPVRHKDGCPSFRCRVIVTVPPIAGSVVPRILQLVFERSFSAPLKVVNLAPSVVVYVTSW